MKRPIACSLIFAFAVHILSSQALATPVLYCKDGPGIDLVNVGCISGQSSAYPGGGDGIYTNAGGGDSEAAVEAAILGATGVAVDITLYADSDDVIPKVTFTPAAPNTVKSGTWTVIDKTLIHYITVKASNSFALYQLAAPSFTGSFSSLGILTNGGTQPNVSHLRFWTALPGGTTPVPEPSSMLLLGLAGLAGLRARKQQ